MNTLLPHRSHRATHEARENSKCKEKNLKQQFKIQGILNILNFKLLFCFLLFAF